jgi:hypothetical protein
LDLFQQTRQRGDEVGEYDGNNNCAQCSSQNAATEKPYGAGLSLLL